MERKNGDILISKHCDEFLKLLEKYEYILESCQS